LRVRACAAALGLSLAGCLSIHQQSTIDEMQGHLMADDAFYPFVEAAIEYTGPQARWAGPVSFMIKIEAYDAGPARIAVTPNLFRDVLENPEILGRAPASRGIPGERARTRFGEIAAALQGAPQSFRGCLSPVKIRLVRADGALLEKKGCRGHTGWPRVVSEAVNDFVSAAIYGGE